ncbi:MAG: hypothetical protein Q4C58_15825 [Eubacteriales bacterium]|nr:hypothetical protein [Eubacteriales bacterium]
MCGIDIAPDIIEMVVNLMKSIYAMREHRDTLVEESLDHSIGMVLRLLEVYISGKGEII